MADIPRMARRPALFSFVVGLSAAAGLLVALGSSISSVLVLLGVAAVGALAVDRDTRRHHHHR